MFVGNRTVDTVAATASVSPADVAAGREVAQHSLRAGSAVTLPLALIAPPDLMRSGREVPAD